MGYWIAQFERFTPVELLLGDIKGKSLNLSYHIEGSSEISGEYLYNETVSIRYDKEGRVEKRIHKDWDTLAYTYYPDSIKAQWFHAAIKNSTTVYVFENEKLTHSRAKFYYGSVQNRYYAYHSSGDTITVEVRYDTLAHSEPELTHHFLFDGKNQLLYWDYQFAGGSAPITVARIERGQEMHVHANRYIFSWLQKRDYEMTKYGAGKVAVKMEEPGMICTLTYTITK